MRRRIHFGRLLSHKGEKGLSSPRGTLRSCCSACLYLPLPTSMMPPISLVSANHMPFKPPTDSTKTLLRLCDTLYPSGLALMAWNIVVSGYSTLQTPPGRFPEVSDMPLSSSTAHTLITLLFLLHSHGPSSAISYCIGEIYCREFIQAQVQCYITVSATCTYCCSN